MHSFSTLWTSFFVSTYVKFRRSSASSDAEESPPVRQALFDEFQEIEWRARVEAIREKLDQQREQRQEQEKSRAEPTERQKKKESEQERTGRCFCHSALRKWPRFCSGMATGCSLGSTASRIWLSFRNVMELEGTGAYRYRIDLRDAALRNAIDERPGAGL